MSLERELSKIKSLDDFIIYYFYIVFPDYYKKYSKLDYINFQIERKDIIRIVTVLKKAIREDKRLHNRIGNNRIIEILEKLNTPVEDDIVIKIEDIDEFFNLLMQIKKEVDKRSDYYLFTSRNLLSSIWLRMGPEDFDDINGFLRKQLTFIKNEFFFGKTTKLLKRKGNLELYYRNQSNQDWFESNSYIEFFFRKVSEDSCVENYYLPSVHYGIKEENGEKVVYVFGIQNVNENEKNPEVRKEIHSERKKLRNKELSPDFMLSLKYFIDLMIKKGIHTIKVPMLQVYNYDYHEAMSEQAQRNCVYDEKEIERIEQKIQEGIENEETEEYIFTKEFYNRFYNKQDLISKNKTERLLLIIEKMQEIYDNIEILNEPMIQGDYLLIRIKEKRDNLSKSKVYRRKENE